MEPTKTRKARVQLTDSQKEEIRTKFAEGATPQDIATDYGVSLATAIRLSKTNGSKPSVPPVEGNLREQAEKFIETLRHQADEDERRAVVRREKADELEESLSSFA